VVAVTDLSAVTEAALSTTVVDFPAVVGDTGAVATAAVPVPAEFDAVTENKKKAGEAGNEVTVAEVADAASANVSTGAPDTADHTPALDCCCC
jgi:hypothetical protein